MSSSVDKAIDYPVWNVRYLSPKCVWCSKKGKYQGLVIVLHLFFLLKVGICSVTWYSQADKKSERCIIDNEFHVSDEIVLNLY